MLVMTSSECSETIKREDIMADISAQAHETTVERQFVAAQFMREIYQLDGDRGGFDYSRFHNDFGSEETLN